VPDGIGRIVALGASNLTRGFHTVVSTARAAWGPEVEVLAALGHGRSYGARSQFVFRGLPGILDSGLWRELEARPPVPTRALVTDVGNDILYGYSAEQTLTWVEEAVRRLRVYTSDIVLSGLPLPSVRRLSSAKYLAMRSLLVPSSRTPLAQALETAERVEAGLARLSADTGAKFFQLDPSWYGFDPIHVRPAMWGEAWRRILGADAATAARSALSEAVRLYLLPPERRWAFGVARFTPQSGVALPPGGRVWLY
jgi:hypothetical protein